MVKSPTQLSRIVLPHPDEALPLSELAIDCR